MCQAHISMGDIDLLHPPRELEQRRHKLKRLVQLPNSFFMDVKCPGCFNMCAPLSSTSPPGRTSSCPLCASADRDRFCPSPPAAPPSSAMRRPSSSAAAARPCFASPLVARRDSPRAAPSARRWSERGPRGYFSRRRPPTPSAPLYVQRCCVRMWVHSGDPPPRRGWCGTVPAGRWAPLSLPPWLEIDISWVRATVPNVSEREEGCTHV